VQRKYESEAGLSEKYVLLIKSIKLAIRVDVGRGAHSTAVADKLCEGFMPSDNLSQKRLGHIAALPKRIFTRSFNKKLAQVSWRILVGCAFLLGQNALPGPIRWNENWQNFGMFSSAFAAGKGSQNGRGYGNGIANQDSNGAGFGPSNIGGHLSIPPDQALFHGGNSSPGTAVEAHSNTFSPDKSVPDFVLDQKPMMDRLQRLHDLSLDGENFLKDFPVNGLALGKGHRKETVQEKYKRPDSKERKPFLRSARLPVSSRSYASGEVLAYDLSRAALDRAQALGFTTQESFGARGSEDGALTRLITPSGMSASEALSILEGELPAEQFHLNRIYRIYHPAAHDRRLQHKDDADAAATDGASCQHDRCYARKAILWKDHFTRCASGLRIGIIDTDVDLSHGTFAGSEIYKKVFMPAGRQVADAAHGTAVLALLAGRSDSTTPGLVAQATFYVASIFFIGDDGEIQTDTVSLLRGLDWLSASDVPLVNMSFTGPADALLEARLQKLRTRGMVFAAAAGNEGLAADPSYPAAYSQVIAVTAVDKNLHVYPSASRGNYIDVAAPGVHVWTALPNAKQGYLSGTSFAVPFMTAMLAIQRSDTLQLTKNELLGHVKTVGLAAASDSSTLGRGLIQAPGDCPNASQIVTDRSPVSGVSLQ
jgi:hypothetical protein